MKKALIILFFVFVSDAWSYAASPLTGYVLKRDGLELFSSTKASKVITVLPYNSKLTILHFTNTGFRVGAFTTYFIQVSYKGYTGYCPACFVFRHKLMDTTEIENAELKQFLNKSLPDNSFSYSELSDDESLADSIFIDNIALPECYYLMRLALNDDTNMPMPVVIDRDSFTYADGKMFVTKSNNSTGDLYSIKFDWGFDGGNTRLRLFRHENGIIIVLDYFPD